MDWQAFWLTIRLSALVAAILVVLGLPVAFWITYSRWRWKFLVEAVFALPIVLPPTVLGFYVLVALGPHSPLGRGWQATYRTHPGVHLRRPGDRFDSVQFSVRGAALRRFVFGCGPEAGGGVADAGRFPDQDILPDHFASVALRTRDRGRSQLCPHYGRVWGRVDGGREHPRSDANGFD